MIVGFVGSGNMAAAMARGWASEFEDMLFSDSGSGRAQALADELGGEVAANAEIAARAELLRRHDPAALRRAVASPGGSTEAGLEALDREGARHAFEAAVEASLKRMRG